MSDNVAARLEREKQFHDHAFADNVRAPVRKYYTVVERSRKRYTHLIASGCSGKSVLEYGCGTGSAAFHLAQRGARVIGIDISPVAIEKATAMARELGIEDRLTFTTMDAEHLEFADASFDLVCGTGVLHHLSLDQAYKEIARVLKTSGRAVFSEPLGHNLLINLYRRLTPRYRTVDEHPLLGKDLVKAKRFFGRVDVDYYHLLGLAAVPFRRLPFFPQLLSVLDSVDAFLLRLPSVRNQAWMIVMVLASPRKE